MRQVVEAFWDVAVQWSPDLTSAEFALELLALLQVDAEREPWTALMVSTVGLALRQSVVHLRRRRAAEVSRVAADSPESPMSFIAVSDDGSDVESDS
jgi:hypothetical protein